MLVLSRQRNESVVIDDEVNVVVVEIRADKVRLGVDASAKYRVRKFEKKAEPPAPEVATIVVVEIRGDKVRLGVEAPAEVPVHRIEVFEALKGSGLPVDTEKAAKVPAEGQKAAKKKPKMRIFSRKKLECIAIERL
jgi:carbon storage regulator CsrA